MTDQEKERILSLTDGKDYGIFAPPMDAQVALNELCRFFLGEDWYTTGSISNAQVNAEIVYEIENLYKKSWIRKRQTGALNKMKNKQLIIIATCFAGIILGGVITFYAPDIFNSDKIGFIGGMIYVVKCLLFGFLIANTFGKNNKIN